MNKFYSFVFLTVLALALSGMAGNAANPDAIELEPMPRPVEMSSDMDVPVPFDEKTTVTVDCPDDAATAWLASHFRDWYGAFAPKVAAGASGLALRTGDEAYAVRADASGVKVAARTLAGVRWAAYSLRQLAIAKRGTFKTAGHLLPTLTISDAPHLAFRGIHLCWFPEVRKEQVERAIRLAALMKFNYVVLEPWGMFKSERHPWWSWPDAKMTKPEVRRLVALGRDLGVTLVPQIAAYGHAGAARACSSKHSVLDLQPEYEPLYEPGGWNWCLTNPETQKVLRELIAEMLETFDRPPYLHLGCDEAQPPTCPECRKRPYGELVCEHITKLAAFAKARGARAMIWHDMLLDSADPRWKGFIACGSRLTATLADTLPRDVIVCDWQYGDMKERRRDWPTLRHFRNKGFPVVGCPWLNFNAMKPMADCIAEIGGFGFLETTWHHLRGRDWVRMYRFGSAAAWGSREPAAGGYGTTPQSDVMFDRALRMVGYDMRLADYRDTGHVDHQVPPSWWIDN
ncbi:MAG: family 20 glycosylhydrolase [Kiritimatiellia bacterium]|nr:family 20 glycosylhydrolase [Kiritimatiellia bacterium]